MPEEKTRKKRKDPRVEKEFFEEIEITDPKTGEKKIQKVKITRYKAVGEKLVGNKGVSEEIEDKDFQYSWDFEDEDF